MARTQMWLRVLSAGALSLAFGCAGDDDGAPADNPPIAGSAGVMSAAGAPVVGTMGGVSGGAVAGSTTSPPPVAGGGTAGVTSTPGGSGGSTPMTSAGGGGMAGMDMTPPAAGMAGTDMMPAGGMAGMDMMAGTGSVDPMTMPPGDAIQRGPDPTAESTLKNGPYTFERYTTGMRNGPEYAGATIYYPTSADAKPPYGAVTVVPGFTAYQSSIAGWGPFLASHGIIAMTIDTNTTSDPPATRARALMDALKTITEENTREGSPIKGKVDTKRYGVSGWSMGGGGTLIAAKDNPTLKAAVSFAAWGPTGGTQNKVPALMFEATADVLAAAMSDGFYSQTPNTTPKMLFEVQGSSHNVANSPKTHNNIIGQYGLSWFKVFLEGDTRYMKFLTAMKPSITTAKFKHNLDTAGPKP